MRLQQEIELLRRVPIFTELNNITLKLQIFTADRIICTSSTLLFREGETK